MRYQYDGTYDGFLSAVFDCYVQKDSEPDFTPHEQPQGSLFGDIVTVETDKQHAARVRAGIAKRTSEEMAHRLYRAFLTEQPEVEKLLFRFIRLALRSERDISDHFADATVLRIHQLDKQMGRELHRMHAFVRFQETQDGEFVAVIEPDFNVLPLLDKHFVARYPAQNWLIYDVLRRYGLRYDSESRTTEFASMPEEMHLELERLRPGSTTGSAILAEAEHRYQQMWRGYFKAVNIPERRNVRLHTQHVPRRYWRYLMEKQRKGL